MDKKVQKVLEEKILEILDKKNEINSITNSLELLSSDKNSFRYGTVSYTHLTLPTICSV